MNQFKRSSDHQRRGSIAVAAVFVTFVVFGLCVGFLQLGVRTTNQNTHSADTKNAFYLAEAGLAEAYGGLAMAKTGNVGTPEAPASIGDGLFWVEATDLGGGLVQLESTALYGRGRASLGLVVRRTQASVANLGFFLAESVKLNPDILVDSFDSSQGTYSEQLAAGTNLDQAVLGSNGDVSLSNGVVINGDVIHGPTGSASVPAGALVTGSISGRPASQPLPPVEVPDFPTTAGVRVSDPAVPYVLPPGEHHLESFELAGKSRGVFKGPATIVIDDLRTGSDSLLTFDTRDGPIDLYITGGIDLGATSSAITVTSKPQDVTLQLAGPMSAHLGAKSLFSGQIYAPEASLRVPAQFEVFGSVVAKELSLAAQGRIHIDVNNQLSRDDVLPQMWSWRVVDVPNALASKTTDPFSALGVSRQDLPAPAAAHEDQWLLVSYENAAGAIVKYEGWESDFDWTRVSAVVSASRDGTTYQAIPEPTPPQPKTPPGETPEEPKTYTPREQALIDLIDSETLTSVNLRKELLAESPLTDGVLEVAIDVNRIILRDADLKQVLLANSPLSEETLFVAIVQSSFSAGSLKYVLLENSPLSQAVLEAALVRDPPMSATDLNEVLAAQ